MIAALFYPSPSKGNDTAAERFMLNRFTVTRQLHFSPDKTKLRSTSAYLSTVYRL